MKRILFAWEMGANFGHVNKVTQVARQLSDQMDVTIAARNVISVRDLEPNLRARLVQAPYSPTRPMLADEHISQCYPGALAQEGWDNSGKLVPLIEAWRTLFDLVRPDVLVAQAAPTALLAARGLKMKTAVLGSGYDAPPRAVPMPCYAPEDQQARDHAVQQEADALRHANAALQHFGEPHLTNFCDLLEVDRYLLVAYPQSDHFAPRKQIEPNHTPYLGQLLSIDSGLEIDWQNRGGPRIMAYLRPGTAQFNAGVQGLAAIGPDSDIILSAPGIDPKLADSLRKRGLQVIDAPVRLDRILPDCDLGVSHGTNGIGSAFIAKGVPQVSLPTHREQMMFAQTVAQSGLGLGIAGQYDGTAVVQAIQKALGSDAIKVRSAQVRQSIVDKGLDKPAQNSASILEDLSKCAFV